MSADDGLIMFAVYDKPRDFPEHVVVRRWLVLPGELRPHFCAGLFSSVDEARASLSDLGLFPVDRNDSDDPCLVETWL